jgi:hypothetical protein
MSDAWVWDMYRPARFVNNVECSHANVTIEEVDKPDLRLPEGSPFGVDGLAAHCPRTITAAGRIRALTSLNG